MRHPDITSTVTQKLYPLNINRALVPRLSTVAISELEVLDSLMLQVQLTDSKDVRTSTFEKGTIA